jgi:hypothetical protein
MLSLAEVALRGYATLFALSKSGNMSEVIRSVRSGLSGCSPPSIQAPFPIGEAAIY